MRLAAGSAITVLAIAFTAASPACAQDKPVRAAVLALGAAAASDACRRGRLGGIDQQGLERHDQGHDLSRRSSSARRSTITTWRATASSTSRTSIRATSRAASRSSARSNCRSSSTTRKEGSAAMDAWYRKYADQEMKDVKYCLMFAHDPGTFHFTKKKVEVPTDMNGAEVPAGQCGDRKLDALARRDQRAGRGARNPRRAGKGRGGRRGLALGLDGAVRHRQGHADSTSTRRSMSPSRSGC